MSDRHLEPVMEFGEMPGSAPAGPRRRRSRRDVAMSTQVLVLGWCLWLAGSWGVALLFTSTLPAARWLILLALMALMLIWPAARLSGAGDRSTATTILVEWLCLILVLQAAIWPLRIVSQWRWDQTLWLAGALAAWSLLSAAIVAMGLRRRHGERREPAGGEGAGEAGGEEARDERQWGARMGAMTLCVLLVVGEPAVMALSVLVGWSGPWTLRVSPLSTVWALVHPVVNVSLAPWPQHVMAAAAAALGAWLVVALTRPRSSR